MKRLILFVSCFGVPQGCGTEERPSEEGTAGHAPTPTVEACRAALDQYGADCDISLTEYDHGHVPRAVWCRTLGPSMPLRFWGPVNGTDCASAGAPLEEVLSNCPMHRLFTACSAAVGIAAALAEMPARAGCTVTEVIDKGCHDDRNIRGGDTPSQHTYGTGCDIAGIRCGSQYYLVRDHWDTVPIQALRQALEKYFRALFHPGNDPVVHWDHIHAELPIGAGVQPRPSCELAISTPSAGAIRRWGEPGQVCWEYSGECNDRVRIHLYEGGVYVMTLAANEPISRGCIPFEPTPAMPPSTQYRIGVSTLDNQEYVFSGPFSIVEGGTGSAPLCGNCACDGGESCTTCPGDCGVCSPPPAGGTVRLSYTTPGSVAASSIFLSHNLGGTWNSNVCCGGNTATLTCDVAAPTGIELHFSFEYLVGDRVSWSCRGPGAAGSMNGTAEGTWYPGGIPLVETPVDNYFGGCNLRVFTPGM